MRFNHWAILCAAGLAVTSASAVENKDSGKGAAPKAAAPAANETTINLAVTGMT